MSEFRKRGLFKEFFLAYNCSVEIKGFEVRWLRLEKNHKNMEIKAWERFTNPRITTNHGTKQLQGGSC